MGLPPATPTFGVGLNMGLPLSLINTSLTSLTSNVITTSSPLLNLGLSSMNTGLAAINPSLNHLNAINSNLTPSIGANSINNGLSNLGQDLSSINAGVNTGINRLNAINSTNISSRISGVNTGLAGVNPNLTSLNSSSVNPNLAALNTNLTAASTGVSGLPAINPNANLTTTGLSSGINQGLNRPASALSTGLTSTGSLNSSGAQFPFQTIQSIQSIAPHIVGSSNIAHIPSSAISQHPNSSVSTISQISNPGSLTSSSIFTSTPSETIHATTANVNHASNVNLTTNIPHLGTMHSSLSNISTSNVQHIPASNDGTMSLSHVSSLSSSQSTGFQPQRQYSQGINPGLNTSVALTGTTQPSNVVSTMNTVKSMQSIQGQNISSPGSPFSIPLKSPNIAPPTPSPSPNRLLLRSPASNSIQSSRNSPSPVATSTANNNFNMQMQSPMQSPMSVSQIQSPVLSPYPHAKSPHLLSGNNSLNNRSPAPGGSPGPPVVRPNTPILQQGMQVLQIIHGTPQGYQSTPTQLVATRTHLFGNQQIQIAATKPAKQPPQILPKPPNQQVATSQQKPQRAATTTITNQVTQPTQPQLVLAGPQPSPTTATMIPTAQGLLLNQVLPSTGPVIVQQQPGGVQLILRTPASAQQQTHTAQLTQQQLVRVVTAQGMQLQGIAPTFFAVPNGFPSAASPVIRHTPSSPAPSNSGTGNSIVIQNAMVQSPQPQMTQVTSGNTTGNTSCTQTVSEQTLLPPPKKKAKKKKKAKRKDDEPPKLDLASIMKISGIGDDDDIFDTELTAETETAVQAAQQSEANTGQSLSQLSSQVTVPVSSAQSLTQVPVTNTTNAQASNVSHTFNSQLVAQLQMPVQNPISGQLRLAVGEDGRVVLHHTPEPNQPEIDQATAQALIRSLTQGNGQNSQIISQLFSQAQSASQSAQSAVQATIQNTVQTAVQRPKYVKSPSGNQGSGVTSTQCAQNVVCTTSPHHGQISSKPMNQQKSTSIISREETNSLPIYVQNSLGPLQSLEIQTSKNVNVQNLMQVKTIQSTNSALSQTQSSTNTPPSASDVLTVKPPPATFGIQGPRMPNASQTNSSQQSPNIALQKSSQVRLTNACITTNTIRQNVGKQQQQQQQQHAAHLQKSLNPSNSTVQTDPASKTSQNLPQASQQETLTLQQESPLFQHNQQITAQTVQTQNVQQIFEHNLQSAGSNIHHNSMNILQQQSSCNTMQQHDTMNVLQHSSIQQNTINVLQQNTAANVQNIEQNLQSGIGNDMSHGQQQNVMTSLQQQQQQQNVNVQQQKMVTANTFSSVNAHHFESQNSANVAQGINPQQSNQNQNILITTHAPASSVPPASESQKVESQGANILNSAANNILNNAPKITPEILNALSNLNPNDQLLIANANGQMQVISQQLLQQFLAGQLNATGQAQNQNQTQKIVIGEPDTSNQNLQGVQINTPTSQIIVNSSGGAPTIQNNIQNIVVQAAPSQMPQHIQIQNSSFPSQFIDNLNQQQIRNLGNNQPKKKNGKKQKVAVTTQSIVNSQAAKSTTVTRPTMVAASAANLQKVDNSAKTSTTASLSTNPTKSESTQVIANGPLISSSAGAHASVPSNGQMVQRVQTIQLPAQKQQMLKNIQSQIHTIAFRKSGTPSDQAVLAKLYQEQAKILASGKVVSTTTHSVNSAAETTFSVNVISTVASNVHPQNSFKNQTSAVQTQTQTTATMPVTSQTLIPTASITVPSNSNNNYINNITVPQSVQQGQQTAVSSTVSTQSMHQTHTKQHKFNQTHGNQIPNPSSANMQIFSPPIASNTAVAQLQGNTQQLTQAQAQQQQTGMQQSAQCQTDPLDMKSAIQTPSPVKRELSSPIQVQVQGGSPAGQVTSPRMIGKGTQRIQSPVNTNGSATKQLVSPSSNSSPLISPRQSVKRRATSPICRQINRSDFVCRMEQQLKIDQNGATNPDMNTPFSSKRDACKRLVRYHCLNEQVLSPKDLAKADEIFEETSKHLLSKFSAMMNKYTYLLLMESMREVRTSELMMIDRTFVAEEQNILNRLREQEAKVSEELKKEEKPLVPKVEPGLMEEEKSTLRTPSSLVNVSVKRELEDDFPSDEMECKPVIKTTNSSSGDYDEWLEIQKELGVYPSTTDTLKCKNGNNSASGNASGSACAVTAITRSSKIERTRANGECLRGGVANAPMKDNCEQDNTAPPFDRRWSSATDLERDLLEDTDSLDGLALHSQTQCPSSSVHHVTSSESGNAGNEHDEITAQVQSAIDSILNLKKRPTNTLSGSSSSSGSASSQSSDSKDTALDQAVRSILGS